MLDNMVFKAMKKRIDPYLEPGEELLSVTTPLEAEGIMHGYLLGGELGVAIKGASRDRKAAKTEVSSVSESGVKLRSTNMTLAITSRRLLIFKFGNGRKAKPEFLLTNVPIGDVDSIQVGDSRSVTRPVTVTVQGESFELEVRRAVNTDTLTSAFAQVKSGTPGIALGGGLEGSSGPLPPAGWYADPQHVARLRYWEGGEWTDHTAA